MILKTGNMWSAKADLFCITANSAVKADGTLVMGAGIAREAAYRFPNVPALAGAIIKARPLYHLLKVRANLALFQTKFGWQQDSPLHLIEQSTKALVKYARANPKQKIHLNFPGIGCGGIDRRLVLPIIRQLPDNVTVWERFNPSSRITQNQSKDVDTMAKQTAAKNKKAVKSTKGGKTAAKPAKGKANVKKGGKAAPVKAKGKAAKPEVKKGGKVSAEATIATLLQKAAKIEKSNKLLTAAKFNAAQTKAQGEVSHMSLHAGALFIQNLLPKYLGVRPLNNVWVHDIFGKTKLTPAETKLFTDSVDNLLSFGFEEGLAPESIYEGAKGQPKDDKKYRATFTGVDQKAKLPDVVMGVSAAKAGTLLHIVNKKVAVTAELKSQKAGSKKGSSEEE